MEEQNQQPTPQPEKPKKKFYRNWWFLGSILFLVIIGGAFYWYEYRPTKIKSDCQIMADSYRSIRVGGVSYEDRTNVYNSCLHRRGL